MRYVSLALAFTIGIGRLAAPAGAATPAPAPEPSSFPGQLSYDAWTATPADQKPGIVRGEMDGIISGYFEPFIIILLTSALTGNKPVSAIGDDLAKRIPQFSRQPADYIPLIDALYAGNPKTHRLPLGNVLACLADKPYGTPGTKPEDCLKNFL